MKNVKWVFIFIVTCFILLVSCDNDSNNLVPNPVIPEDTTYNFAYEDSILLNSTRILGNTNVQISSINGTGIRRLCDSLVSYEPMWLSSKRKILFIGCSLRNYPSDWGIYQIDLNNYKMVRIAPQDDRVTHAAYSPDMKYIAYTVWDSTYKEKVKLYDRSSGLIKDITDWLSMRINSLSWSPNSKDILIDGGYFINIENPGLKVLFTFNSGPIYLPMWSPDGLKVSFSSQANNGWMNIYIYDLISGETKLLYPQELYQYCSSWSRDSKQILFDQCPSGINANSYICKIDIDGSNFVQLTDGTENNWSPRWYK